MLFFGKTKINKSISQLTQKYNDLRNNNISSKMEKLKLKFQN